MSRDEEAGEREPLLGSQIHFGGGLFSSLFAGIEGTLLVLLVHCGGAGLLIADYVTCAVILIERDRILPVLFDDLAGPDNERNRQLFYMSAGAAGVGFLVSLAHMLHVTPKLPKPEVDRVCGAFTMFVFVELFWLPLHLAFHHTPSDFFYMCLNLQVALSGFFSVCWGSCVMSLPKRTGEFWGQAWYFVTIIGAVCFYLFWVLAKPFFLLPEHHYAFNPEKTFKAYVDWLAHDKLGMPTSAYR
mmetsp:Transcript_41037/g.76322  ORF Transcript_41037/g.76322 Transcript_41037/m.76322 type:complete len:243 (-) Transcript_41037:93-821(-)